MLQRFESADGATLTVYSNKIAIGGVTSSAEGGWYWAIFSVRPCDLDRTDDAGAGLGGVEHDRERAFGALSQRWSRWIDDAGLIYADASY